MILEDVLTRRRAVEYSDILYEYASSRGTYFFHSARLVITQVSNKVTRYCKELHPSATRPSLIMYLSDNFIIAMPPIRKCTYVASMGILQLAESGFFFGGIPKRHAFG
jgi:hypothetical protein